MLQIRLNRAPSSEAGVGTKTLTVDTVTVACPDHLVLADLPVAKSLGAATAASVVKIVGRRSRRQLGERVHFCVRCDFPIAIYGRLSPCEHAFCLDCARSDSICYLCEERIEKIQTIKMMEGIFVCAAPHCLKSFLKKTEFESHIYESHADLLDPNREKGRNESVNTSAKKYMGSDSTVQVSPGPIFSPPSNSQLKEREDKAHRPQPGDQPSWTVIQPKPTPFPGQILNHPLEYHPDNRTQGFDKPGLENRFPEYPMHPHQPPNFALPMNQNLVMAPSPFNPYFTAPHEMLRTNFAPEVGSEQGSLGFSPGPAVGLNFPESYPQPWIIGPSGLPFEPSVAGQRMVDGFTGMSESQGRAAFFQGGFGPNPGAFPSNPPYPPTSNKGMEPMHYVNAMDGNSIASQSLQVPPSTPSSASNMSHLKQGNIYSVLMGHDGQSLGWQQGNRDSFGSGEDK